MRNLKETFNDGDTLIEVIFAFAILATIIGFAFTGAIQARKTVLAAQQRTQAVYIAQYQSQSLMAYRESLPWDDSEGIPNFIGIGNADGAAINNSDSYCMAKVEGSLEPNPPNRPAKQWLLLNNSDQRCSNTTLQAVPSENVIQTSFRCISPEGNSPASCDLLRATVEVKWLDPYGRLASVKNLVNLAKKF